MIIGGYDDQLAQLPFLTPFPSSPSFSSVSSLSSAEFPEHRWEQADLSFSDWESTNSSTSTTPEITPKKPRYHNRNYDRELVSVASNWSEGSVGVGPYDLALSQVLSRSQTQTHPHLPSRARRSARKSKVKTPVPACVNDRKQREDTLRARLRKSLATRMSLSQSEYPVEDVMPASDSFNDSVAFSEVYYKGVPDFTPWYATPTVTMNETSTTIASVPSDDLYKLTPSVFSQGNSNTRKAVHDLTLSGIVPSQKRLYMEGGRSDIGPVESVEERTERIIRLSESLSRCCGVFISGMSGWTGEVDAPFGDLLNL